MTAPRCAAPQTRDADRRRRSRGIPCGGPGPASPLRRGPPDRARGIRRRCPGNPQATQTARRNGRDADRRLPDAADDGYRVPRAGDGPVSDGATGTADRLRRQPRRHRRDQRRRPRPLPAQAVGSTGGEALSGHRRAAGRVEAGAGAPHSAHQGDRAPLVGTVLAGPRLPGPQRALLHLVHGRRARPASSCCRPPARTACGYRSSSPNAATPSSNPPTPSWPTRWA